MSRAGTWRSNTSAAACPHDPVQRHRFEHAFEFMAAAFLGDKQASDRRAGQRHLTPLVGREEEIALLMRRWERARQGDGQLVLIVGEPGLGKSRLVEELHGRLRDTPHTWTEWSGAQLLQNTPLHPVTEWGRVRFGSGDTSPEQRLMDLEGSLAQVKLDPVENAALLAPLLDIPLLPDRS
jgi:AAA ATPase domain